MLNIIGGSYVENCIDPSYQELYGSGLRAAAALSQKGFDITFYSLISADLKELAELKSRTFGYKCYYWLTKYTIEFDYYHPLTLPSIINYDEKSPIQELEVSEYGDFLYYGMLEANFVFQGNFVVYDPQNYKRFNATGSKAKHLAIILNKNEALHFSSSKSDDVSIIGNEILKAENAEVVVIKNGANGAYVIDKEGVFEIPVFTTNHVWPIGSGDIFTAIFAWQWIIEKKSPRDAAYHASRMTAIFCQTMQLPINEISENLLPREIKNSTNKVYLAGPFFTVAERWIINEIRNILIDFGNEVFSPLHDVGILDTKKIDSASTNIAKQDLDALTKCDTILAIVSGLDAGTLFEVGFARAIKKRVIILAQNVNENDLTMLIGSKCKITKDLSTAIYMASW
jgi:nucleoside 2-deoxyribosyltransferase